MALSLLLLSTIPTILSNEEEKLDMDENSEIDNSWAYVLRL
jgi:hypothetical protein